MWDEIHEVNISGKCSPLHAFYFYNTKLVILTFCSVTSIGKLVNNVYIIRILLGHLLQNQVSYYDYTYLPVWLYFSSIVKFSSLRTLSKLYIIICLPYTCLRKCMSHCFHLLLILISLWLRFISIFPRLL